MKPPINVYAEVRLNLGALKGGPERAKALMAGIAKVIAATSLCGGCSSHPYRADYSSQAYRDSVQASSDTVTAIKAQRRGGP